MYPDEVFYSNQDKDWTKPDKAMRLYDEPYALAARIANDGLWEWDLNTNRLYVSTRWFEMLGYEEYEIEINPDEWFRRVHPDDIGSLQAKISAHCKHEIPYFEHEYRIRVKDESYRWMLCRGMAAYDEAGNAYRIAGAQTDITERKWAEAQQHHSGTQDELTGLSSRTMFIYSLEHAFASMHPHPHPHPSVEQDDRVLAVLVLDLDRFKVINSSLGHVTGDRLLIAIARMLEATVPPNSVIARFGEDEFTILMQGHITADTVFEVANDIQERLKQPFFINGREIFASVSIGIALYTPQYTTSYDLLRDADTAMYHAKENGGGNSALFHQSMHHELMARLQLEADLRQAIERQEFCVYYMPIVSLSTGMIYGFEALVRWQHPELGLLEPMAFISLAEECGLINFIDRWVLFQACQQLKIWNQQFPHIKPLTMGVNFSSKQFSHPDLVAYVYSTIQKTGVDAENVRLEITESVAMENVERSIDVLCNLRALNIHLEVDDFGTGFSSLSYLHRLPTTTLKIDRSFVSRMGEDEDGEQIVRTIIVLAQNLRMSVTAEGVETPEHLALLRGLNCTYGQGYLFSKPVDSETATALLQANPNW